MTTPKDKKAAIAGLALMVIFLAMTTASCGANNPPSDGGSSHNVGKTFGIYSPGTLDEVTLSARQKMLEALGVDSYGAFQAFVINLMHEAGASWASVDFWYDGNSFYMEGSEAEYLQMLRTAGFEVIGTARPINNFAPADLSKFEADVSDLVEQHPWIEIWQVGNEPNLSFPNPDDYPPVFLAGERAIREACPSCKIMLAGIASTHPSKDEATEIYRRFVAAIVEQSGTSPPFDILDLHFYGNAEGENALLQIIDDYRKILQENGLDESGVEIWLSETATYTGKPTKPVDAPEQTEDQQAGELVRRFVASLGAGLARVSWARPYENYMYGNDVEDGFYDVAGLVYNGLGQEAVRGIKAGTKKKAWYAYQTLASKVSGYNEVIYHAPGAYEFDFDEGKDPVFVFWANGAPIPAEELLPGEVRGQIKVTDLMGNETETSSKALVPGAEPVFVERS